MTTHQCIAYIPIPPEGEGCGSTRRVHAPEQAENGRPVSRMRVFEAVEMRSTLIRASGTTMSRKFLAFIFMLAFGAPIVCAQQSAPLRLLQTIPLPNVHGRIDHFDVDLQGQRLFMSALGNNTLEVFDLRSNKVIYAIHGLREPQGVTYVPKSNRIFVANGDDGTVRMFDGNTYQLLKTVQLSSDADDTRYDSETNQLFVGYGDGAKAGIAILDGTTGDLIGTIKLPDHPEAFQLEEKGPKIYVNIPSANSIVDVLNRNTRKIVATWTLDGAQDNFPMTLDETNHRLFITCRAPAEVLVLDTESGRVIARIPSVTHADDMWYDAANKRVYVSGGGGFLTVIEQQDADRYRRIAQIKTASGARTSCLVPELRRFYLGVWGQGGQPEELLVYQTEP